jgi:preprotein translocase subunit SecG
VQLFLNTFHIILSIALILIILLQPGKDQGAVFGGGGGNKMYAPRGGGNLLGRATTAVAVLFMFTSISLAYYSTEQAREGSNIEELLEDLEQEDEEGSGFFEDRRPADMAPPADLPELETLTPSPGADVDAEPAAIQGGQSSDGDAPDDSPENSAE